MQWFHYHPNEGAAVFTCILFIVISIPLSVLAFRTGMRLSWILVVAALAEALGYAVRAHLASTGNVTMGPYIVSVLLILLAPNALALLNYKVLGHVIELKSPAANALLERPSFRLPFLMNERGLIYSGRMTGLFLASDVICFLVQGAGGGQEASNDPSTQQTGKSVIIVGLVFQVIFFFLFAVLSVYVYISPLYNRSAAEQQAAGKQLLDPSVIGTVFFALFSTVALILARNVYRLIQFAAPLGSYIPTHEWLFYVFDMLAIFTSLVIYTRWHFGLYLPRPVTVSTKKSQQLRGVVMDSEDMA